MKTLKQLFTLICILSLAPLGFSQHNMEVDGSGRIFGDLQLSTTSPTLYLGGTPTDIGALGYYDNTGILLLPESFMSYHSLTNEFAFSDGNNSIGNSVFSIDVDNPEIGVHQDGLVTIGRKNAVHLTLDRNGVQAKGSTPSINQDLFLNVGGGNIVMTDFAGSLPGRVGIGTSTPEYKLDVVGRIQGDDIVVDDGILFLTDAGQDVQVFNTGGDFMINTIGASGTDYQLYIEDGDGHVGINTNTPATMLHIKQLANNDGMRLESSTNTNEWTTYIDGADDINFGFNGVLKAYIWDTDGSYHMTSDRRLKKDIKYFDSTLNKILDVKPASYRYTSNADDSPRSVGVIAQELEQVFPELISEKDGFKGVNYTGLTVFTIKAIQEQQTIINQQASMIQKLEARLTVLENK